MIGRLEPKHWLLIAGFLGATATVIGGLDHWGDLLKPAVISGLMLQLATHIGAIFAGAPPNPHLNEDSNPHRRETDVPMGSVSESTRANLP